MNKINWTAVAVFGIVVLLAFVIGASLLGGWGFGGWGMMGPGMTLAPARSAGVGGWGFGPFGWIGTPFGVFMWLIPVGFVVLTVLGVVWLVRAVGGGAGQHPNPPSPARACPSCGRAVQADWRNCPHCGAALTQP